MRLTLLSIEWQKNKSYKTFWILFLLFAVLFFAINQGIATSILNFGEGTKGLIKNLYSFPFVWDNLGFYHSLFVIFLCVFIIISVTNEFTYRTARQHIIDGLSRLEFLHAKCLTVLGTTLIATALFVLYGLILGHLHGGGHPLEHANRILYVFVLTLNYLSLSALIGFFIRRSGLSIILLFAYFIIEFIIQGVVNHQLQTKIGNFLPLQCSDELLPFPILKQINGMLGVVSDDLNPMYYVMASLAWIAVYYSLARIKLQRNDL